MTGLMLRLTHDQEDEVVRLSLQGSIIRCLEDDKDEGGHPIEPDMDLVHSLMTVLRFYSSGRSYQEFINSFPEELRKLIVF